MTEHLALAAYLNAAPRNWEQRRFRFAVRERREKNTNSDRTLLSLSAAAGIQEREEDGGLGRQAPSEATITTYGVVYPGDLVINPMWALEGGLASSNLHGAVSPAYRIYTPVSDICPRYLHYLVRSSPYLEQYRLFIRGITTFDRSISRDDFQDLPILVPPLDEQRRIAGFLDAETARIDQLLGLQQSFLEKSHQRDRAVRDYLVDKLVGKVGELPLRRYSPRIEQGSSPSCENHPRELGEWGVLKLSAVKKGKFFPNENKQLPGDIEPLLEYVVHDGDLLVTRANTPELVGDVAVVFEADQRLLLPDLIYRLSLDQRINVNFVAQVFLSTRVRSLIEATARGSSQSMVKLRGEDIREWPVPSADVEQQMQLVEAIDGQLRSSDKLRAAIIRQLVLLNERRQALITAAVTGGITV